MDALTHLDLQGLGRFTDDFAGFEVARYGLERDWDYVLGDERLYWRVHHNGKGYLQELPPGGTYWLRATGAYDVPPWLVHVIPDGDPARAFTNFRGPQAEDAATRERAGGFLCRWSAGRAVYQVRRHGLVVETDLGVAASAAAAVMRVRVTNRRRSPQRLVVLPRLKPWLTAAQPAAWDMPWLYQATAYDPAADGFTFEMRHPGGDAAKRRRLRWTWDRAPARLCLSEAAFVGRGTPDRPAALSGWRDWPAVAPASLDGEPLFAAGAVEVELGPGESWELAMSLCDGREDAAVARAVLDVGAELDRQAARRTRDLRKFQIRTPDPDFTRYVNEYLSLQELVALRRGWPCNMMGVRDSAQDHTAAVAWWPEAARRFLLAVCATERTDGWFLRQFSIEGRHGRHDARPYVDSGLWVWELAYEYVCQTRDFAVLAEPLPFLDADTPTRLCDHLGRLLGYFMAPENLGEHGLCKIREGDWNDSANRAGLAGRGESVMVSAHLIYCLRQAAALRRWLGAEAGAGLPEAAAAEAFAGTLRQAIRSSALNAAGFLNGVFSDTGQWFFSDRDPDGCLRFNVPVNAFGLIGGVFEPGEIGRLLERVRSIRRPYGYPLFTPALGDPPMAGLGRIASGDLRPGLGENGSAYNHGCHGFLARALAEVGEGDLFYDVMRCLFPYDQERHPVAQAKSAPFAIVNVYKAAPGREGEGGDTFFSGTIAVAVRNVYQGLLGVHAEPAGLRIRPCLPAAWPGVSGQMLYAGAPLRIEVKRDGTGYDVRVNGRRADGGWHPAPGTAPTR